MINPRNVTMAFVAALGAWIALDAARERHIAKVRDPPAAS
jgi:hypothetical protein